MAAQKEGVDRVHGLSEYLRLTRVSHQRSGSERESGFKQGQGAAKHALQIGRKKNGAGQQRPLEGETGPSGGRVDMDVMATYNSSSGVRRNECLVGSGLWVLVRRHMASVSSALSVLACQRPWAGQGRAGQGRAGQGSD